MTVRALASFAFQRDRILWRPRLFPVRNHPGFRSKWEYYWVTEAESLADYDYPFPSQTARSFSLCIKNRIFFPSRNKWREYF